METKLALPADKIAQARELSVRIVKPVMDFVEAHTTVTVERATLRLAGADGADSDGVPVPNLIVDQLKNKLEHGALLYYVNALVKTGESVEGLNAKIAAGLRVGDLPLGDRSAIDRKAGELVRTLEFLGQAPPAELARAPLPEVWRWARAHWDFAAIPRRTAIPLTIPG